MNKTTLTYFQILEKSKLRSSTYHYYLFKKNKETCFGTNYKRNIENVNKLIKEAKCNNTGSKIAACFNWAYDLFYGIKHNHKLIISRPREISKFTTRLDIREIKQLDNLFIKWINDVGKILPCKKEAVKLARERIYHVYKTLINSGMRIGELCSIDFSKLKDNVRILKNIYTNSKVTEIIINTEKTYKKREIYIPFENFAFFITNNIDSKLSKVAIQEGFRVFRKWAKIKFKITCHTLRRTFATSAYSMGVDVDSICMCLGHTNRVCMEHYILSSLRNFDAFELVNSYHEGKIKKITNMFVNKKYLRIIK
ncbi:MAG: site-specific integrase [Mycoplasmataceae bacterium]|nr:site-specific integrase [Mycoplasmataceae bacterium]